VRLSVAPAATEDLLVQFLAIYLVYVAARNFARDEHSLSRLAWVGFATGALLALAAISQYLGGHRERIYGRFDAGAVVFGPFVNKNHFSFQMHLFIGLAVGLFLRLARRHGLRSPHATGILGGLGLMVAAVGFSQSRGGAIALVAATAVTWFIARFARPGHARFDRRIGVVLLGGVVLTAGLLTAWLGWSRVLDRLASIWQGTADNRTHLWTRAWNLVVQFPVIGVGGGGYSATELATRPQFDGSYVSVSAHNEYLEALIEGGVIRFALTVGLVVAAMGAAVRNYNRTGDPLLLGCLFGMSAVAIHSIGDFGIHVPSVALATAVVAAYSGAEDKMRSSERVTPPFPPALAMVFVLAALLVVAADWRTWQADRLRTVAGTVPRPTDAVPFLEAAARVRPNDPGVWEELALAHLLAAAESSHTALTALVGFAALAEMPNDLPGGDPDGHVTAALKAARMGRNLQPLAAGPHLRLGAFTDRFARSEPSQVHLGRAKRVGSVEPDVWYVSGRIAAARGDWTAALADWRESLVRSPRRLAAIARLAAGQVSPEEFRIKGLPDDPALWFAAAPQLFPDEIAPERAAWMRAIDERSTRREPESVAGFLAWGSALEELSDGAGAIRVWRRGVERYPDDVQLHDRLAARLEAEELFEDALPVLEWLAARRPGVGNYGHRLAAAKHALALKADIDRP
jgi:hypothetical protein